MLSDSFNDFSTRHADVNETRKRKFEKIPKGKTVLENFQYGVGKTKLWNVDSVF